MKNRITFEGDYYEDREELLTIIHASDMRSKIIRALDHIRSILKFEEYGDAEEKRLEKLQEILWINWEE